MSRSQVAIVITCHDQGRALVDTLQSVRNQTEPPSEILIVDEASTDLFTRQVITRLANEALRVLHADDQSVAAVWNSAIRSTEASYIMLLDAGVLVEPTFIERASKALDATPAASFVTCGTDTFGLVEALAGAPIPETAIFRREAWVATGGFDENARGFEERDFWISLLSRGSRGAVLEERSMNPPNAGSRAKAGSHGGRHVSERASMEQCWRKHAGLLGEHAGAVLLAKERLVLKEQERHEQLHERRTAALAQLDEVQRAMASVAGQLRAIGRDGVDLGDLRRTAPISPVWGLDRGLPLDRYYITGFLDRHRTDVQGRVLEVKDPGYTRQFGDDRVTASDVVDIDAQNTRATVIADLTRAENLADGSYDCFILTQVLGLIYDVPAALATAYRILKPGGVLLCTVPASGRISYEGTAIDGDYWRFTEASIRRLFSEVFPLDAFEVATFGNVLANAAFLYGLAPHELKREELDVVDPFFPVVYGIRARKPLYAAKGNRTNPARAGVPPAAILAYHRIVEDQDRPDLCVSPENFRAHMRALEEDGYAVLPLRDLAHAARRGSISHRSVAITFDDGYREALTCAAPVLAEHAFRATFFIVGETLNGLDEFWWDALARVFLSGHSLSASLTLELPSGSLELPTATASERSAAYGRLVRTFYALRRTDRDRLVRQTVAWAGIGLRTNADPRPMTLNELEELTRMPGIDIGGHTGHHVWLPVEHEDVKREEVAESKSQLERAIGRSITSFSYPYGGHDPATVDIVRKAGYEQAVTIEERSVNGRENPFLLPRYQVRDCDGRSFANRLGAIFDDDSRAV